MADDVYLHVGAPKTGTSFIQLALWGNRAALRTQGVALPLRSRAFHFDAVADLRGGIWAENRLRTSWAAFARAARETPEPRAVISEELLCATPEDKIGEVVQSLAPARVHVVVTARDIGRQIPSEWQQSVRARSPLGYGEWLSALTDPGRPFWSVQDPNRVVARWRSHVPAERIHIVTLPPDGGDPTALMTRFSSVIGVDPTTLTSHAAHQNPSLGIHQAEVLRRINARLGPDLPLRTPYTRTVRDHLLRPVLYRVRDPERPGVPDEFLPWLEAKAQEIAAGVVASGINVVGDADDLLVTDLPAGRSPDDLTAEELLDASLDTLTALLRHLDAEIVPRLQRLRRLERQLEQEATAQVTASAPGHGAWWQAPLRGVRRQLRAARRR